MNRRSIQLKKSGLFLLFSIQLLFVSGQDHHGTLLWEISTPKGKVKSYLFATFHEADPSFFLSLINTVKKLDEAELLFVEEVYDSLSAGSIPSEFKMWNKKDWEELLTAPQLETFNSFILKAERPEFVSMPPFILTRVIIGMHFMDFCDGGKRTSSLQLDNYIEKIARDKKKTILSLDESQAKILMNISTGSGPKENRQFASYMTELMNNMLTGNESRCELMRKYIRQEINYELDVELTVNDAQSLSLVERNNRWLKIIMEPLTTKRCFIAVGLRHLFYQQGLIAQLKNSGFIVKPVKAN